MLKKFLKVPADDAVFPLQSTVVKMQGGDDGIVPEQHGKNIDSGNMALLNINKGISKNKEFIQQVADIIAPKILSILESTYGFEPTEKYKEEVENKKKYITQLDNYLKERKEINKTVESDLQQFLQNTTISLSKALESFSQSINSRIHEAENRYGIDTIKDVLLTEREAD